MIVDPHLLLAFLPVALALNLLPGPDMMFCLAQGLRGGPRRAWAASAGIAAGAMVHVTLAGLGLGAAVAAYPAAFGAIRWAGAAYLLWLAWRTWTAPPAEPTSAAARRPWAAFRDGMLVNLSNPKVILFILALLPQFVSHALPVLPQFIVMGAIIATGGLLVNGAVGVFAGRATARLARAGAAQAALRRVTALLFGGLATRMGWEALRG